MKPYIKICGVTNDQDLKELIKLDIDAIGFNRDKDSPRYVSFEFLESSGKCFNEKISPVIVFVNESKEGIKKVLLVLGKDYNQNDINLAIRNVPLADTINQIGLNVYDVLKKDHILFTEQGLKEFEDRLTK